MGHPWVERSARRLRRLFQRLLRRAARHGGYGETVIAQLPHLVGVHAAQHVPRRPQERQDGLERRVARLRGRFGLRLQALRFPM